MLLGNPDSCRYPQSRLYLFLPLRSRYIVKMGSLAHEPRRFLFHFQKKRRGYAADWPNASKHLVAQSDSWRKNRVEDAISAYKAVLDEAPQTSGSHQALGDLYARAVSRIAPGLLWVLFDMLIEPRDESKAWHI